MLFNQFKHMKISKHFGYLLLEQPLLGRSIAESHLDKMRQVISENLWPDNAIANFYYFNSAANSINYIITDTVMDCLSHIKLKKPYEYMAFNKIPDGKRTFLLPNDNAIRILKKGSLISFGYYKLKHRHTINEEVYWNFWTAFLDTGKSSMEITKEETSEILGNELAEELFSYQFDADSIEIDEHKTFALLSFIFLADTSEEYINPRDKVKLRGHDKLLNDSNLRFIKVNSKWNITTIRSEEFAVTGHYALRWTGEGRLIPRMVFIEPYTKHGYIIKSKLINS